MGMAEPQIVDYDPRWAVRADCLLKRISGASKEWHPRSTEHIGSTAVPGLGAKPFVDLQMTFDELPPADALTAALAAEGFERAYGSRPDSPGVTFDIPRPGDPTDPPLYRKLLFTARNAILHVRLDTSPFARFVVDFRDWLREHPAERDGYEQHKRDLAAQFAGAADYDDYTRAKTAYIDEVHERMRAAAG